MDRTWNRAQHRLNPKGVHTVRMIRTCILFMFLPIGLNVWMFKIQHDVMSLRSTLDTIQTKTNHYLSLMDMNALEYTDLATDHERLIKSFQKLLEEKSRMWDLFSSCKENVPDDDLNMSYQDKLQMEKDISWHLYDDRGILRKDWNICAKFTCSRDPRKCNSDAKTVFDNPDHPPCCNHLLRDMLFDVQDWFDQYHIHYFVHYGTLLGAVRSHNVLPWTADLDVAIDSNNWTNLVYMKNPKRSLWNKGYNYFADGNVPRGMGRLCFSDRFQDGILSTRWKANLMSNESYLDVFPYMDLYTIEEFVDEASTPSIKTHRGPCAFPKDWIYPLSQAQISGREFPIPNQWDKILTRLYGNWRTPSQGWHGKHECN
eukprot:TRINITY_DN6184_c0_g2_i1.p1 TRINITY_DN6184_c0_g2~~TRINITY_DN6184_c0_g2_i1.p1  ORF type:complete len:371 (+),score=66.06 TRINITY_DN6184_c0_g2_i1:110-1222(+)